MGFEDEEWGRGETTEDERRKEAREGQKMS